MMINWVSRRGQVGFLKLMLLNSSATDLTRGVLKILVLNTIPDQLESLKEGGRL